MKKLYLEKPGVIGKQAAAWHLFKQEKVYPTWFFLTLFERHQDGHKEIECVPMKCAICKREGTLYYSLEERTWKLDGLDVGHIIGRDRNPALRYAISNVQPECRECNNEKER